MDINEIICGSTHLLKRIISTYFTMEIIEYR